MVAPRRRILVGNWKMHGTRARLGEVDAIDAAAAGVELVLCLPAPLIPPAVARVQHIAIGAQDCHVAAEGPYTGGISAEMLADAGASWVILGHSECRATGVTDRQVAEKLSIAAPHLRPILCVGERRKGDGIDTIARQLQACIRDDFQIEMLTVAYEPAWAIGTGATPFPKEIATIHAALRAALVARFGVRGASVRILYGGSISPENAGLILDSDGVAGLLVGRASLTAESFLPIIRQFK